MLREYSPELSFRGGEDESEENSFSEQLDPNGPPQEEGIEDPQFDLGE